MARVSENAREQAENAPERVGAVSEDVLAGSAAQHASTRDVGPFPLANRLAVARYQRRLSLRDVAAQTGVPLNTLSRIERGYRCRSDHYQTVERWLGEPPPTPAANPAAPSVGRTAGFEADPPPPSAYRSQAGPGRCFTCGAAVGQVHDDDCPHRARGPQPSPGAPDAGADVTLMQCPRCGPVPPSCTVTHYVCPWCNAPLTEFAAQHQHTAALAERDRWLLNELIGILAQHCGERGESEGAVDTLKRIIRERDAALAAAPHPPQEPYCLCLHAIKQEPGTPTVHDPRCGFAQPPQEPAR